MARNSLGTVVRAFTRAAKAAERDRQRRIRQEIARVRFEQREQDREERLHWQQTQRELRDLERQERQAERERVRSGKQSREDEKARQKAYLESRQKEAEDLNSYLQDRLNLFSNILVETLKKDHGLDLESLRKTVAYKSFTPPKSLARGETPNRPSIQPLPLIEKLIPGRNKKHQNLIKQVDERYKHSMHEFEIQEAEKKQKLDQMYLAFQSKKESYELKAKRYNDALEKIKSDYANGESSAVLFYCKHVLKLFGKNLDIGTLRFRLVILSDTAHLIVEHELPTIDIVPDVTDYRYIKMRDAIESKIRKPAQIKGVYADLISSLTLSILYVLFQADVVGVLKLITFNGILNTHDRATGKVKRVPIISVRATREEFGSLNLKKVNMTLCLRKLGAQISPHPEELLAVKPIVHFDMVDRRFVDQTNLLGEIDNRPNLMDLNPTEFEVLVANLFGRMGLDTKLTRSTRDGGVDAIAFDVRPILGGKVVIQAKRYSNTVGVSAVRDLFGTMHNEGANKGILVCTSKYGNDAYRFSKDKPIELIDGQGLLYLLREHAQLEARIIFKN